MRDEALDLLEKLLALTEPLRKEMAIKEAWQKILARAANLRAAKKCGSKHESQNWRCQLVKAHEDAHEDVYRWFDAKDFYKEDKAPKNAAIRT